MWKNYEFKNFTGIVLDGINTSVNTSFCPNVLRYINDEWDEIVCCNFSILAGILAIQYMKVRNIKYWIEGDGGFAKNGRGIEEKIKKYLISGAKGWFSTSDALNNYYLTYGVKFEKNHRYRFSSISKVEIINLGSTDQSNHINKRNFLRTVARNELGIDNKKIIVITVGRFIHIKGFDVLPESAAHFKRNVCFYFVGGEPTKGVTIMGNTNIGDGSVVGALSPVNNSLGSNGLYYGIPARIIRKLNWNINNYWIWYNKVLKITRFITQF